MLERQSSSCSAHSDDLSTSPEGSIPLGYSKSVKVKDRHFFGLRHDHPHMRVHSDDYENKFPPDEYGEELSPNSRFWHAYGEETALFDTTLIGQYRDGVDVMLVFAGLFSAVVTSFLVQASQSLQADYAEMSAILLFELLAVQRTILFNTSTENLPNSFLNPNVAFTPNSNSTCVNVLWVVSLTFSLLVALAAVLFKQWLHHYITLPSGTPGYRGQVRQFRYMGLAKWRVSIVIGLLPITMHISLALFLVGLILFFRPLHSTLAYTICGITSTLCVLYLISNMLPALYPDCPYQTPLTDFVYAIPGFIRYLKRRVVYRLSCQSSGNPISGSTFGDWDARPDSLVNAENHTVIQQGDEISLHALTSLFDITSNPTIHSLVIQAIGGLNMNIHSAAEDVLAQRYDMQVARASLLETMLRGRQVMRSPPSNPFEEEKMERVLRSILFMPNVHSGRGGNDAYIDPRRMRISHASPRLQAVLWGVLATDSSSLISDSSLVVRFFRQNQQEEIHPLVWLKLMRVAMGGPHIGPSLWRFPLPDRGLVQSVDSGINLSLAHFLSMWISPTDEQNIPIPDDDLRTMTRASLVNLIFLYRLDHTSRSKRLGYMDDVTLVDLASLSSLARMHVVQQQIPLRCPPLYDLTIPSGWLVLEQIDAVNSRFTGQRSLHVSLYPYVPTEQCYFAVLLRNVLGSLECMRKGFPLWQQAMDTLVLAIIEHSPLCEADVLSVPLWALEKYNGIHIETIFIESLHAALSLYFDMAESHLFSLPLFGRVLHATTCYLRWRFVSEEEDSEAHRVVLGDEEMRRYDIFQRSLHILLRALHVNNEDAVKAFMEDDWLELVSEERSSRGSRIAPSIIDAYVNALTTLSPNDPLRIKSLAYLHEPHNLFIALFNTVTGNSCVLTHRSARDGPQQESDKLEETRRRTSLLVNLWPRHTSWFGCYIKLKALLACPTDIQFRPVGEGQAGVYSIADVQSREFLPSKDAIPFITAGLDILKKCISEI